MLLFAGGAFAEGSPHRAGIHGRVSDPSGAVLSGALIRLRNTASGRRWSVVTRPDGSYSISGLPAGDYTLTIHQGGFSSLAKVVRVSKGEDSNQPLRLSIASVVQQVEVRGRISGDGLTARQIRESSARDLGEAAQNIAGVDMVRKAAIANGIAIRGLFHNNLATAIDGVRMYGACTEQMDPAFYHIDLSEVDHVDVVKGPFDVTTQGSMGGYVKVVTRTPDVNGFALNSNVSTGSYGYYNPSATLQTGNSAFHSLIGYSYRTSEFYRDGNGNQVSDLGSYRDGVQNLQAFRTQSAWTKLAFDPTPHQRAEIAYTRQQSGNILYPYLTMDGVFDNADRLSAHYDYFQPHRWLHGLHGVAYVDKINHLMDDHLRSSAGTLPASMNTQIVSFTDGARLDADLGPDLTAGYEFHHRYWNSDGFMMMTLTGMPMPVESRSLPGVTQDVSGGYIAYYRAIGNRFLATAGARYDHSHIDASQANPSLYEAYHATDATQASDSGFSGNVTLSWQATHDVSFFAGVGSNIRFPDPEEQFFNSDSSMSMMGVAWVGNPLLTHPRDTEYDLGLTARNSRYSLRPLVYFSSLANDITLYAANMLENVPGISSMSAQSYANVQAYEYGGELAGSALIMNSLSVFGTLSYARGVKDPQPSNSIFSSNLFQVPPIQGAWNLRYERQALYAEASAIITGRQNHVDTDENELPTAGYSVFNLHVGYHAKKFHLQTGANNLLAREYSEFLSYARDPYNNGIRLPEPGRNFFANLSYTFRRAE